MDTFICGACHLTFHDINLFVTHKNTGCETTEVILQSPEGEIQTVQVIEAKLGKDGVHEQQMCVIQVDEQVPASGIDSIQ